jgi:hypothetical protein
MDEADDFFGTRGDIVPEALRPLGLVVPARARVIFDAKGNVLYDELAAIEAEYRMNPKALVTFDDSDDEP